MGRDGVVALQLRSRLDGYERARVWLGLTRADFRNSLLTDRGAASRVLASAAHADQPPRGQVLAFAGIGGRDRPDPRHQYEVE
jgi:hypothetical protein